MHCYLYLGQCLHEAARFDLNCIEENSNDVEHIKTGVLTKETNFFFFIFVKI